MLSNNVPFELDRNAIFLRNQELNLHHNKLYSIQKRKNKYLNTISCIDPLSSRTSRNNSLDKRYFLTKGNQYLYEKLYQISTRDNQALADNRAFNSYLSKKNKAIQAIKELNDKKMQEFNNQYYKRVLSVNSVVDLKKMEQDFQITRKAYKFLRKIQPHKSAANIFQTYASYQAQQSKNNSSKSTTSKKEKLPPLSVK